MNFLLTGATGFIGTRLIRTLLARRHLVSIFTRRVREPEDRRVGQFYWNLESPAPAEPFHEVDAVIHLAGEPVAQRWTDEAKRRIRDSRIAGTRNLVEGIARLSSKPRVLVAASAIGYYGDRGDELLSEDSPPGRGFLADTCVTWEREADRACELGLRVAKIRTGIVLGLEGGALKKMLPPFKLGLGGPLGGGNQWMSWIHIDDLIEMFLFAAENTAVSGALNGVAPNPVTNTEFTRMLGRALRRPAFLPVPASAVKALFGEMAEIVLASQRVTPQVAIENEFVWRHPLLAGALASLLAQ